MRVDLRFNITDEFSYIQTVIKFMRIINKHLHVGNYLHSVSKHQVDFIYMRWTTGRTIHLVVFSLGKKMRTNRNRRENEEQPHNRKLRAKWRDDAMGNKGINKCSISWVFSDFIFTYSNAHQQTFSLLTINYT